MAFAGEYTALRGAPTPNARAAASAALRWSPGRVVGVSGSVRSVGYAHSVREGYFAPERHTVAELGARLTLGGDVGLALTADGGVGVQSLAMPGVRQTSGATRGSVTLALRPRPGTEISATATTANVAGAAAATSATGYRYRAAALGVRLGL
jgi:hypothetical protein